MTKSLGFEMGYLLDVVCWRLGYRRDGIYHFGKEGYVDWGIQEGICSSVE